jgi:biopolymer transport protein ExbD
MLRTAALLKSALQEGFAMSKKRRHAGCETDMTPMIDVVFQLIIFFVVAVKLDAQVNREIVIPIAPHGSESDVPSMVVEVDRRGWLSINGAQLSPQRLLEILKTRKDRNGIFPVLICADRRTEHKDIKTVMDVCSEIDIRKVNFAVKKK